MKTEQELRWHQYNNPQQVADALSLWIVKAANQAIAEKGLFKIVLAGGSTPGLAYKRLNKAKTDWSKWHIFFGDERCYGTDHPERNSKIARMVWLDHVEIPKPQIYTIPAEQGPIHAAKQYRELISQQLPFDLVLLGMGEDGHTASLFPGHEHKLDELVHEVYEAPKLPPERVSLSSAALSDAEKVIIIITGEGKQPAVHHWREGMELPVSSIKPESGIDVLIDDAALPK